MSASWPLVSSSVKKSVELAGSSRARARKLAICSRVTVPLGQNLPPPQPEVMPASAIQMMSVPKEDDPMSLKLMPIGFGGLYGAVEPAGVLAGLPPKAYQ